MRSRLLKRGKREPAHVPELPEPTEQPARKAVSDDMFQIRGLPSKRSAIKRTSTAQNVFFIVLAIVLGGLLVQSPVSFVRGLIYFSAVYYLVDFLFYMRVILRGLEAEQPNYVARNLTDKQWPTYTILCPMYREKAVLPQFVASMDKINYPKDKLQVMLLLEEDDDETVIAARNMDLPEYFDIVVVPDSQPKTKPKACNYGLVRASGEYCVIYDAEDVPDPNQLKIAATAHRQSKEPLGCVQAKLNFYNHNHNFLTRLFTLEYSLWFEVVLPGLMSMRAPIPLGGTSNHFKTSLLRRIGAWDPYNVTEDADLGMRLAQLGYRTLVIDSTTLEEPNGNVRSWVKQRSRWIKGYMQTHLVHSRNMLAFVRNGRVRNVLYMHILLGIRSFGLLFSALMLTLFIGNTIVRLLGHNGVALSGWVYYILIGNLVFINLMYIYTYALGIAKRQQWGLLPAIATLPVYWFLMLIAAGKGLYELVFNPYYWQKTEHGIHLQEAGEHS